MADGQLLSGHIHKAKNFPGNLLKSIARADAPYTHDLHGYTCAAARDLMRQAFSAELPHPAVYTFILGCGQHSLKQYKIELRKACLAGLREAGFEEDRHASDGAQGRFKAIDDRDHGMHMVRVFPRLGASASVSFEPPPEEDLKSMEAELRVDSLQQRASRNELEKLSLLGLAEFLSELLPVLLAGRRGRKHLDLGEEPEALESRASDVLEDLQEAWKLGWSGLQRELVAAQSLTAETRAACCFLFTEMEAQPTKGGSAKLQELRNKAEGLPVCQADTKKSAQEKKLEQALKPIEEKLDRWSRGRFQFRSPEELKTTQVKQEKLQQSLAELKQEIHQAARLRTSAREV
ncbi:unnamed protein product [Symbiodinium sp. CCMP2592]|nr:unnamed protein product [Symbiodinium sp. CCMP2592]